MYFILHFMPIDPYKCYTLGPYLKYFWKDGELNSIAESDFLVCSLVLLDLLYVSDLV